jgi:serine/threonine protein kinase
MGREKCPYDSKVDVFSLGSVLYEILTGQNVFPMDMMDWETMGRIHRHELSDIPDDIGAAMKRLITQFWKQNPDERPTFNVIFRQLDHINFMIRPDVNPDKVREYVQSVLGWETRERNSEAQRPETRCAPESRLCVQIP